MRAAHGPGIARYPLRVPAVVLLLPKTGYRNDDFLTAARRLGVEVIHASDVCHQLAEQWEDMPVALRSREAAAAADELVREVPGRSPAAALARLAALLRSPDLAQRRDADLERVLVEEFIPGPEVALEGLLSFGRLHELALFDKPDPLDGPFFEETLYVTPSRHPAPLQDAVARAVQEGCAALGLSEGPVHAELRLSPQGPRVLEIAARSIGGLCGRALRF